MRCMASSHACAGSTYRCLCLEALQCESVSKRGRARLLHICEGQKLQGLHGDWPLVLCLIPILLQLPQQLAQPRLVLVMQRHILGEKRLQG